MPLPSTANVARPQSLGFGARLDSLLLRLAASPDRPVDVRTADLAAPQINTGTAAEEFRNEFGELFARSDFTGGEGLAFAHKRDLPENAASRFFDSKHIDISNPSPGHPPKLTLAPPTANVDSSAQTNLHLAFDGTAIYMASNTTTRRSTTFTDTTPSFADDSPGAGAAILDLTNLGSDLYAAITGAAIYKRTGGVWASLGGSSIQALKVWGVKRQLLGSTGTVLQTVNTTTGAAITTLATLSAGQSWLDVSEGGAAIVAAASDGKLYLFGNNASAILELKAEVSVGPTEVPYAVGYNGSQVFYATREATATGAICRFYRADLDDTNYRLGNSQLLKQWGDQTSTIDYSPRKIIATRDAVLVGIYETAAAYMWRYDNVTTGLSRYLDCGTTGTIVDALAVGSRIFVTVSGHGLYREKVGSYETDGYLIGPLGDFFSAASKSWAGALIDHDTITSDSRIELYYTTDPAAVSDATSASWQLIKRIEAGQDIDESPLPDVDSRYLAGMVKLYANTGATVSPSVRSFTFRAYPGDGDVIIDLQVVVSDTVEIPGRRPFTAPGLGLELYNDLKGREGSYAELEVYRLEELLRGVVQQVGARITAMTERGSVTDVAVIRFRGRRVDSSALPEGLWGTSAFGLATFGGLAA